MFLICSILQNYIVLWKLVIIWFFKFLLVLLILQRVTISILTHALHIRNDLLFTFLSKLNNIKIYQIIKCLNQIVSENKPYNLRLCTFKLHTFQEKNWNLNRIAQWQRARLEICRSEFDLRLKFFSWNLYNVKYIILINLLLHNSNTHQSIKFLNPQYMQSKIITKEIYVLFPH